MKYYNLLSYLTLGNQNWRDHLPLPKKVINTKTLIVFLSKIKMKYYNLLSYLTIGKQNWRDHLPLPKKVS